MIKLYKLVVLFLIVTAMNNVVQAQEYKSSSVFPSSKVLLNDVAFFNYPNPATLHTTVSYNLAVKAKVSLKVLDLTGKQLAVLLNLEQTPGKQEYYWDLSKKKITSGMYILILKINNDIYSRKVIVQ